MSSWAAVCYVGVGGFLGSALRYGFSVWCEGRLSGIPFGTLAANLLGCLIIGFLTSLTLDSARAPLSREARLFLSTGFCGGLTTLSSFINELGGSWRAEQIGLAGLYAGLTLFGAGLAYVAGFALGRLLIER